jgi:predicted nucleotidyltransferase
MNASLDSLLTPNERQAVEGFIILLHERYPKRILRTVLFGSKARGDSRTWSDIDVLVVVDEDDWQFQHAISTIGARVSLEYDVLIGPRVIGQQRWEQLKDRGFGLYKNIVAEGIPLTPASSST